MRSDEIQNCFHQNEVVTLAKCNLLHAKNGPIRALVKKIILNRNSEFQPNTLYQFSLVHYYVEISLSSFHSKFIF